MRGVGLTRVRLLGLAAGAASAIAALPRAAFAKETGVPHASEITVRGAAKPFSGDRSMFVTISPESAGRDTARVLFRLGRRARVRLDAVRTGIGTSSVRWTKEATLGPGRHEVAWTPADDVPVGSYVMRITVEGKGGRRVYGGRRPASPQRASAPVVHVLGIEAAFTRRSYLPTERMAMQVLADVPSFTLTFLRVGHGPDPSLRNDELVGLEMGEPVRIDWTGKRSTRQTITVQSGDWPSGLYAARLEADIAS